MLSRAGQLGFRPERLRLYQRLQALLAEELPYVPLYVRAPVDGGAAGGARASGWIRAGFIASSG